MLEFIKGCIDELYPDHNNALAKAGLRMNISPNLKELWENSDKWEKNESIM